MSENTQVEYKHLEFVDSSAVKSTQNVKSKNIVEK